MCFVTDSFGEFAHDGWVVEILFLRRDRQQQVMLDKPRDEPRVVAAHAMFEAESLGIDSAELGVITATALSDIVEKPAKISDFGFRQGLHDRAATGVLVIEPAEREASQIFHDEQCVGVHGISVKEVVLHPSDDAAEAGNVKAQYAIGIHAPQRPRDALRRFENI